MCGAVSCGLRGTRNTSNNTNMNTSVTVMGGVLASRLLSSLDLLWSAIFFFRARVGRGGADDVHANVAYM